MTNVEEIKLFSVTVRCWWWETRKSDDGLSEIEITSEFINTNFTDPIESIVSHTYSDIQQKYKDEDFLKFRGILASTNEIIDQIDDYVLNIILGEEKEYFVIQLTW